MIQTVFTVLCFVFGIPGNVLAVLHLRKTLRENREARWGMGNNPASRRHIALPITLVVLASLCLIGGIVFAFYRPAKKAQISEQAVVPPVPAQTQPIPALPASPGPGSVPTKPHINKSAAPPPTPSAQNPAPTYGLGSCIGSACAQGPGATATYNQYGAPKLNMTDEQRKSITDAMKPYAGTKFFTYRVTATEDSAKYAGDIEKALTDAGLISSGSGDLMAHSKVIPGGVSLTIGQSEISAASALGVAMMKAKLISKPIPTEVNPSGTEFVIWVTPER